MGFAVPVPAAPKLSLAQANSPLGGASAEAPAFSMDNDNNDYRSLLSSIIMKRRHLATASGASPTTVAAGPGGLAHNVAAGAAGAASFGRALSAPLLMRLPPELLLLIFHHLERKDLFNLLTVCKEFADLIVEILWFRPHMQNDTSFKKIRHIMELPPLQTYWDYRTYIKRLNLSFMTKLVDDDLLSLFVACPKLERLTLVNCTQLTHTPITQTLVGCDRLQLIDLTGVTDIHDDIILALAQHCTRLQGLYAPGCGNVLELAIITLLQLCPMLKRVKFNNSENLTDALILAMHENCPLLVEIDLHNCPNITDQYLKLIFRYMQQLREFRILNAAKLLDNLFELLPEDFYLEKLRIIDITGCNAITDKLVERLVYHAPRVRNVVLSKCMQITDASLRLLLQLGRSLHYIHLGHCLLITDFGVASLVRLCHRIQYIDLACCAQLTDWTLVELANLPKLRRIGLVKCNLILDNGILEFVRRRGEQDCLERVHLLYCANLTIGPIYLLLKNCPKLTHLSLTGIASFLRNEITAFCRDPPPDFTETQRNSFCVFSGHGVNQLRNFLTQSMEENPAHILDQGDMHAIALERGRRFLNGEAPNNNFDADSNGWAGQRVPNSFFNIQIDAPSELVGNMAPEEMREHFQMLIRNHHQTRIRRQQQEQLQQQQQQQHQEQFHQQQPRQQQLAQRFGQNAPQIVQPPVFGENLVYVGRNEVEDIDMGQSDAGAGHNVNLFPRARQ